MKPILHMIMGGDSAPTPIWAEQHAESWRQYADVQTWDWDSLTAEIGDDFKAFCDKVESPRYRANYARHALLFRLGGGYSDWDAEPVQQPFRDDWGDRFVIASHPRMVSQVDNCFMYVSKPGHPVAKKILDQVDFTQLTAKQITVLTNSDEKRGDRLKLPTQWNCDRDSSGAVIHHYYMGASLNAKEMEWLKPRLEGKKVTEAGTGLRSIELVQICDLTSVEHQAMYADRATRGGCKNVILEPDLYRYPATFADVGRKTTVALIDGRRRNACFEELAKVNPDATVYIHDTKRDGYQLPNGWEIIDSCDESERGLIGAKRTGR